MDRILLRFRDLTQGIQTIDVHNSVVAECGKVYWGWWKKEKEPFPDPILSELANMVQEINDVYVYFINSDTKQYYKAKLYSILYTPGISSSSLPEELKPMCPEYYRDKELPAWFQIGEIEEVLESDLNSYVLSRNNRTTKNYNSIPDEAIGNFITDVNILSHPVSMWFMCDISEFDSLEGRCIYNISSGSYPVKENASYILHLSDLHFGDNHAYKNPLSTTLPTSKELMVDALVGDLTDLGNEYVNGIGLVIISGDISWAANPHEFSNAIEFITKLKQELGIGSEHIIVVPGNHDIEWLQDDGKIDTNAELNYRNFYKDIYNSLPLNSMVRINQYKMGGKNVCIVALNSCRLESPENAGYGYVGADQLKIMTDYFRSHQNIDYKIAVLHHHLLPVNYMEDYDPAAKRISMLLDSESVMQSLVSCGVQTVLHGHQHQPYFSKIRRVIPGFVTRGQKTCLDGELNVVGAGSLGVQQPKLNVIGRNSYNILKINDNKSLTIMTRIKSSNGVGFYSDEDVTL